MYERVHERRSDACAIYNGSAIFAASSREAVMNEFLAFSELEKKKAQQEAADHFSKEVSRLDRGC